MCFVPAANGSWESQSIQTAVWPGTQDCQHVYVHIRKQITHKKQATQEIRQCVSIKCVYNYFLFKLYYWYSILLSDFVCCVCWLADGAVKGQAKLSLNVSQMWNTTCLDLLRLLCVTFSWILDAGILNRRMYCSWCNGLSFHPVSTVTVILSPSQVFMHMLTWKNPIRNLHTVHAANTLAAKE